MWPYKTLTGIDYGLLAQKLPWAGYVNQSPKK